MEDVKILEDEAADVRQKRRSKKADPNHVSWKKDFKKSWVIYLIFLVPLVWLVLFHYIPLFGIIIAWKDYDPWKGFFGSEWNGWENWEMLFTGGGADTGGFLLALRNTCVIGLLNLTLAFLPAVIFALLVSQVRFHRFRRICQMLSYLPNFVSAVVIVQLMQNLLGRNGPITMLLVNAFGAPNVDWTNYNSGWFWIFHMLFGIWQGFGFGSIAYVAAIHNIDDSLYEAAALDGADRWQMMWKITMPQILPMILMYWMLSIGLVFKTGFDKTPLLYNPTTNADVVDMLFSFTMRHTQSNDLGISTASSLFQSVIGTTLMLFANWLSRKMSGFSII